MKIKNSFIINSFVLIACGCSSSTLKIETTPPGADVFVKADNQPIRKVGQSPIQLDATDLSLMTDSFVISIQKPGFKNESIFINSRTLPFKSEINTALQEEFAGASTMNIQNAMDEIARVVAQVQDLTKGREYEQALNSISNLISRYPSIGTLYGLQGNIYYLQKNLDKALTTYQKANKLSPTPETDRMIRRIEELRGRGAGSGRGDYP